jgi:hypothetical protein
MNAHWNDRATLNYIKNYYDEVGAFLLSIEHMLRTQWFLKQYKIPYFMTEYSVDCLPRDINVSKHSDISYLLGMIDRTEWLSVDNMWQWAIDSGIPFARPPDPHPATEHHFLFTKDKIIPHLFSRGIIL